MQKTSVDVATSTFLRLHKNCSVDHKACKKLIGLEDSLRARASYSERLLWEHLKDGQLGSAAHHQFRVVSYIVDFYFPDNRLVVEVDGAYHKFNRRKDKIRDAILRSHGVLTLRVSNDQVKGDVEKVLSRIKALLVSRAD